MFPPIELAEKFLLHYEVIRLQQPDSIKAVISLPRLNTPGSDYKHLVKKYKYIHTYPAGSERASPDKSGTYPQPFRRQGYTPSYKTLASVSPRSGKTTAGRRPALEHKSSTTGKP
jgi:hypothetical protein